MEDYAIFSAPSADAHTDATRDWQQRYHGAPEDGMESPLFPFEFRRCKLYEPLTPGGSAVADSITRAGVAIGEQITVYDCTGSADCPAGTIGWSIKPHDEADWEFCTAVMRTAADGGVSGEGTYDLVREGVVTASSGIASGDSGSVELYHVDGTIKASGTTVNALNWCPNAALANGQRVAVGYLAYQARWTIIAAGATGTHP